MTKIVPSLVVATFSLFIFVYGACISGIVLREPDICFLLASGKWIVEHGQLPTTDPFSYSTIYHPVPYVIEKWLTEIIFFGFWKYTSTAGLLVFDAIVLTLTFTIMPYRFLKLSGVNGLKALLLATLTTLVSFIHLAIRPEVFSFLIMAIYLEILIRRSEPNQSLHYPTIIWLVALMVLWSNLHTLFIVGVMILGLYSGCIFVEQLLKLTDSKIDWTIPIAFALSIPATLVTPYGFTLWEYLPNIFGPFNDSINEMKPIALANLKQSFMWPFLVLIVVSIIVFVRRAWTKPTKPGQLFFKILLPAGIAGGIKTIRTIPISDLFAAAGIAQILKPTQPEPSPLDQRIDSLCQPFNAVWVALTLLIAGLGAYFMTSIVPPNIPTESAAFVPPVEAIKFIGKNRPQGRLLNDPHFGNVLMWQLDNAPPVFIDSRYNLFGNTLLKDYWIMADDKPGARKLLDKYAINWVFLNAKAPLIKSLSNDANWTVLFQDPYSAVVARKTKIEEK